jgi:hypothetical protein
MRRIFSEAISTKEPGFFARQFGRYKTDGQDAFDMAFGVVLPILCFVADPLVFKGNLLGAPLFEEYQLLAYTVSGIEIAMLLIWRFLGKHLTAFSAPFAGVLMAGSLFSIMIGVLLLPYSVIGIAMLIGLAGFTPFLTGFVYLRNGVRAMRAQLNNSTFAFRFITAALSAVLVIALPALANNQLSQTVSASVADLIYGDPIQSEAAANRLKLLPYVPSGTLDRIVNAYARESNPEKKEVLKQTYRDITGEDIEVRLQIVND